MKTGSFLALLACACALPLSACSTLAPTLPDATSVSSIEVSEGYNDRTTHVITNPAAIRRALGIIQGASSSWSTAFGTYPTPAARAIFHGEGKSVPIVLWFGPGWVGATSNLDAKHESLLWNAKPSTQQDLRRALDLGS